jgi:hypothetical protein
MRRPRQPEPRIVDPSTHPQKWVNLSVAAEFLGMDRRALHLYIAEGVVTVEPRGRRYKMHIDEAVRFKWWLKRRHSLAS